MSAFLKDKRFFFDLSLVDFECTLFAVNDVAVVDELGLGFLNEPVGLAYT